MFVSLGLMCCARREQVLSDFGSRRQRRLNARRASTTSLASLTERTEDKNARIVGGRPAPEFESYGFTAGSGKNH
jgi:hypothetical protein